MHEQLLPLYIIKSVALNSIAKAYTSKKYGVPFWRETFAVLFQDLKRHEQWTHKHESSGLCLINGWSK